MARTSHSEPNPPSYLRSITRHIKQESQPTRQRTRKRARDRIGCEASGVPQPRRNLPTRLRMEPTPNAPSRRCNYQESNSKHCKDTESNLQTAERTAGKRKFKLPNRFQNPMRKGSHTPLRIPLPSSYNQSQDISGKSLNAPVSAHVAARARPGIYPYLRSFVPKCVAGLRWLTYEQFQFQMTNSEKRKHIVFYLFITHRAN